MSIRKTIGEIIGTLIRIKFAFRVLQCILLWCSTVQVRELHIAI